MRINKRTLGKSIVIGTLLIILVSVGIIIFTPDINWRVRVIMLKLSGELSELSWTNLSRMLRPGSLFWLRPILETKNAYSVISNPNKSDADIAAGARIYREECAACHGSDGKGTSVAARDFTQGNFAHGESDWALFRTILSGVSGTAMPGREGDEVSTWQLLAFIRSLARDANATDMEKDREIGVKVEPVGYERLLNAEDEPRNWLTYSGTYKSHRYSALNEINRSNVKNLQLSWTFQTQSIGTFVETTPLVVDGIMYLTEPPNNVWSLDTRTGKSLWSYKRNLPQKTMPLSNGPVNRGVAILDNNVYMGTLDAHLVALDTKTGALLWDTEVAEYSSGFSITTAPLAVDGKIIIGVSGGEFGIRGFLDAYDAITGDQVWRFYTIPGPDEPGNETWEGDSWKTGGAPTWVTGSFDPELNLIYWGTGNPAPVYQGDVRKGDNLYSCSVIALDSDTGKLRWHFQFTPHDEHDWDANQIPVLVDTEIQGSVRRLLVTANRNGFYYVLDRETGEFLSARAFGKQTWATGIDSTGRPILAPDSAPTEKGTLIYPGVGGVTNWWSPSYSPLTKLFYVPVLEQAKIFFKRASDDPVKFERGEFFLGSASQFVTKESRYTAIRALETTTGNLKWEHKFPFNEEFGIVGGALSTAGGLVFVAYGVMFYAIDAYTGKKLWQVHTGGKINASPMTYTSGGKQQVAIAAGSVVFNFGLNE